MSSTARYSSYSCRSGLPQYSLPRSVSTRSSLTSCSSKNGSTRSLSMIRRCDRRLAIIQLGEANLGVGVDEGLLVDAADALQIADVERILSAAIARVLALEFAVGLLLGLGLFERRKLSFGQHQAILGTSCFQRLEALAHGLEIVSLPYAAHAGRRDCKPTFPQFIGDPNLP